MQGFLPLSRVKYCYFPRYFQNIHTTSVPSSRLEKKQTIDSWKRHALCDSVLTYERNRWEFDHVTRIAWGTKYGQFTTINISKYEHFTRKINRIYSHLVCLLWFRAFSAVLSVLCHHCYSCYTTKSLKCTALTSSYKRNNSDGKASVKRQRTPETTTDTKDVSKLYWFYVSNIHISKYLLK